ncbi:MAG TPA: TniQ family protein [Arenimonas sp.]|nr:TniQ family protein [Arenimonas sp.]
MLVVTPRPVPSESMMGYLLRLTERNGYPSTTYLLPLFGSQQYQSSVGRLDAELLASITCIDRADIDRLTLRPDSRPRAYIRIYGKDLPCYEVHLSRPKICAICLLEGRPCEAYWDLAQAVVCPIHRVKLAAHCFSCGKPLTWFRAKLRLCKCGADLTAADVSPANPELCELMALMRYQVYQDSEIAPFPPAMSHLSHLNLRRICKLYWVISGVFQRRDFRTAPKSRSHYHQHLERVSLVLSNWPFGFRDFLTNFYTEIIENAKELPHFRSLFSWLLVRLIKNDEEDGSAYSFLERELYTFGAKYWTRDAMARDGGSHELMPKQMRWGSLTEALEVSGMHWATLRKRISKGDVKVRRIRNKSDRKMIVDLDSIRIQNFTKFPVLSIRDAAPIIGVSIDTLRELRKSSVFEDNCRSKYPKSFTREDVDAFANKLRQIGRAKRAVLDTDVSTLKAFFLTWSASPEEKAGLIALLLADSSLVVGKKPGDRVDDFQILNKTAESYFRDLRVANPKCQTKYVASIRLGCTISVMQALVKSGYIKTYIQKGREVLCSASVSEFDDTYVSMSRMTRHLGVGYKFAYARLDFSKINHIKVRSSQHSTIFFCRSVFSKIEMMLNLMQ